MCVNCSVVSDSLQPHGLLGSSVHGILLARTLECSSHTSHSLLQGSLPTQGLNLGLLHCRRILQPLSHQAAHRPLKAPSNLRLFLILFSLPNHFSLLTHLISAGLLCEGSPSSPSELPWSFKYFPLLLDHFLLYQLLYRTIFVYMSFSLEQTCRCQDYRVSLWSPKHTAWQKGGVH